jgi:seryl-tRNA synthetase
MHITLPKAVDEDLAADLEKQSVYVSPSVRGVRVNAARDAVDVDMVDDKDPDAKDKVERYIDAMVSRFRKLPKKIFAENKRRDKGAYGHDVYGELKKRRWVLELGHGQVGLAGPALAAMRAIDNQCRTLGLQSFGAVDENYPALMPSEVLARCNYFKYFPHTVSMVVHLVEDYDKIDEFRRANDHGTHLDVPDWKAFETPKVCLNPAVCYHCYQAMSGEKMTSEGRCVTAVGRCFRYESKNIVGLDRAWDFTMREIIFVGTEAYVTNGRQKGMEAQLAQVKEWDLDCVFETANDPFFSAAYATKTYWQVRNDLKFEMRLNVEPGPDGTARTIACASANLHENFFGKTFEIGGSDGNPVSTGCAAWGLERLVLALFTQHGFDKERWPESLRSDVWT